MATSLQHTSFHEPEPRRSAGGATIGDKFFIYRGNLKSFEGDLPYPRASHVHVFAMRLAKWSTVQTTGQHPPSLWGFACVAIGHRIYYFGGYDGTMTSFTNALHEFDSIASHWRALDSANPDAAPMAKMSSAVIAVDDETLCTLGGFGMPTGRPPAGSRFVPSSAYRDGRGRTNEIHLYSLRSSKNWYHYVLSLLMVTPAVMICVHGHCGSWLFVLVLKGTLLASTIFLFPRQILQTDGILCVGIGQKNLAH